MHMDLDTIGSEMMQKTTPRTTFGRRSGATLAGVLLVAATLAAGMSAARAGDDQAELVKHGKRVFNKCKICHSTEAGKNKIGPSLHGIFGSTSGDVPGYNFSEAMKKANIVWTDETLATYLHNPHKVVPGTKMAFAGLHKDSEIKSLLAYLHEETK